MHYLVHIFGKIRGNVVIVVGRVVDLKRSPL